jgi:hypothetical protein
MPISCEFGKELTAQQEVDFSSRTIANHELAVPTK